jgi:SAM-dependent methyltransferase
MMTILEQYVHGYRPEKNLRLHDQAGTLLELPHCDTGNPPGRTVLEVGCGVGSRTVPLAERSPGARITSADISTNSVAEAEKHATTARIDNVTCASANVYALPHHEGAVAAQTFDHVFVYFLLEHLPGPVEDLTRMRSMLNPGGSVTVIEGDHGSTHFHPDSDAIEPAIAAGLSDANRFDKGLRDLRRTTEPDGMFSCTSTRHGLLLYGAGHGFAPQRRADTPAALTASAPRPLRATRNGKIIDAGGPMRSWSAPRSRRLTTKLHRTWLVSTSRRFGNCS